MFRALLCKMICNSLNSIWQFFNFHLCCNHSDFLHVLITEVFLSKRYFLQMQNVSQSGVLSDLVILQLCVSCEV